MTRRLPRRPDNRKRVLAAIHAGAKQLGSAGRAATRLQTHAGRRIIGAAFGDRDRT